MRDLTIRLEKPCSAGCQPAQFAGGRREPAGRATLFKHRGEKFFGAGWPGKFQPGWPIRGFHNQSKFEKRATLVLKLNQREQIGKQNIV